MEWGQGVRVLRKLGQMEMKLSQNVRGPKQQLALEGSWSVLVEELDIGTGGRCVVTCLPCHVARERGGGVVC